GPEIVAKGAKGDRPARSKLSEETFETAMPYIPVVDRHVVCALVALAPAQAHADGIAIVGGSPRAIGRAGAATVGDDGGGALLINPAAMARRDTTRGQIGVAVLDDTMQ